MCPVARAECLHYPSGVLPVPAPWGGVTRQPLSAPPERELFDFHKEIELGYVLFWISNSLPSKAIILITWRRQAITTARKELNIKGI